MTRDVRDVNRHHHAPSKSDPNAIWSAPTISPLCFVARTVSSAVVPPTTCSNSGFSTTLTVAATARTWASVRLREFSHVQHKPVCEMITGCVEIDSASAMTKVDEWRDRAPSSFVRLAEFTRVQILSACHVRYRAPSYPRRSRKSGAGRSSETLNHTIRRDSQSDPRARECLPMPGELQRSMDHSCEVQLDSSGRLHS